jgi:hypothetical protein
MSPSYSRSCSLFCGVRNTEHGILNTGSGSRPPEAIEEEYEVHRRVGPQLPKSTAVHANAVSVGRAENDRVARMGPYAIPKEMVSGGMSSDIRADQHQCVHVMLVSQPRTEGVQSSLEMCRGVGSVLRVGVSVSVGRNDHPEILCPNRLG